MYREIIKLYYVDELSIAEVRGTLSLTEPTVKSRLVRARRMLRDQLEGPNEGCPFILFSSSLLPD